MLFAKKTTISVPAPLRKIAEVFRRNNREVYLVGGAVRDMIMGKRAADWDLATNAIPEEVSSMFGTVIPTGIKHGTVTVLVNGRPVEITTFRAESGYSDGRRPDKISFSTSIEDDLSRRDFTMNAIAASLPEGVIIDRFDGVPDIKRRLIRCVGDPLRRFGEDGLRPLRALRFAATLGFELDGGLLSAIPLTLEVTAKVSMERVQSELSKIVMSEGGADVFFTMRDTGLLELLLPELAACVNIEQKGYHIFDVFTHSVRALSYAQRRNMSRSVRFAALLHDIGKPACAKRNEAGVNTFYNHEREGARIAEALLTRLRFPSALTASVVHLIKEHMFHYEDSWSDAAARRFIIRVGGANLPELFDLRVSDNYAQRGIEPSGALLFPLHKRLEKVRAQSTALSLKDLAINGSDLMAAGHPGGRSLGVTLSSLLEAVLEDPALNTREKLLEIAGNLRCARS